MVIYANEVETKENSFLAILMLINRKRNWWKMRFFRHSLTVTKGLKVFMHMHVIWVNVKALLVKWTWHSNKEISHNKDRSVLLPFSNSCFISLISVVEPDKRNIPWWSKPVKKQKGKGKRNLKEETNKQTGFAITYVLSHKDILNKDKIVLHPLKKRCYAISKCNFLSVMSD